MERLIERCAGLDVHRDTVAACVRVPDEQGGRRHETRTFTTTTKGLLQLRDWLASYRVTLVGMESTGIYWRPAPTHVIPFSSARRWSGVALASGESVVLGALARHPDLLV